MNNPPRRENNSNRQFKDLGSLQRMGQALGFPATPSFEKPRPSIKVLEQGGKSGKAPIKIDTDPMKSKVPGQGKVVATVSQNGRLVSGHLGRGGGGFGGGGFGLFGLNKIR